MPLFVAILLSLALHLALILAPEWLVPPQRAKVEKRISATLITPVQEVVHIEPVDEISTHPVTAPETPPPKPSATPTPRPSSAAVVRRAQQALAKHLLYPADAIARGLEGEVTLLLILDTQGRIQSVEIARSSGHAILDQAARDAALRISALPGSPTQTLLPVGFKLQ